MSNNVIDIFTGVPRDPETLESGVRPKRLWTCGTCGSELYYVAENGPHCSRCGTFLDLNGLSA